MADDEVLDEQVDEVEEASGDDEGGDEEKSLEDKLKEAVDVRVEDVGGLRKKLTITVPHGSISEQLDEQYGELRRDAMVPGFRKGRAPRRLLEKRFGNEVSETLVQKMVGTGYLAAIDKTELKVIGDPLIWVREKDAEREMLVDVQEAMDLIKLPDDEPLVFSCEVEVRPEFDLPEVEGIEIKKPVVTVSDEDVNVQINRIRARRGTYETLPDEAVEPDDVVIADVKMSSGETLLKEQEAVRMAARPQVVDGVALEKLGEVLTGARAGEVRTVSGTISDDYVKADFRGQPADFEFKLREVQRLRMPELDDEFIHNLGFETEAELREWVRSEMESRLGEEIRRAMAGQVRKYLLDNTSLELPERVSERQAARVTVRRLVDLYQQGVPPAEAEKLTDELKASAREETARELKLFFIMEKLAEEFEVEVTEGEINGLIASIAQRQGQRFDRVRDELSKEGGLANLYLQIRDEKIIDQLIDKANVVESKPETDQADKTADDEADEFADET